MFSEVDESFYCAQITFHLQDMRIYWIISSALFYEVNIRRPLGFALPVQKPLSQKGFCSVQNPYITTFSICINFLEIFITYYFISLSEKGHSKTLKFVSQIVILSLQLELIC